MTDTPVVSVLMPVAKARDYLASAAESVLAQTLTRLELILIDDDGRAAELEAGFAPRDPRVRVVPCRGKGISDGLNTGIEVARGAFICRVDCDDLIPPERLAHQLRWLEEHPEFGAVCGAMSTMTSKGRFVADVNARHERGEITSELRTGVTRSSLCTFLLRTDAARATGGFRRYFVTAEDIDFQLRFGEKQRVWYEPGLTYWYRLHDSSITHGQANNARVFFEQTARQFQKQRMSQGADDLERGVAPSPPADASRPRDSSMAVQNLLIGASWDKHRRGEKSAALRLGLQACAARPASAAAWKSLAALLVKKPGPAQPAPPSPQA